MGALTTLSRRFQTPYPIVLVVGGLLLSFIPNLPQISLNPDIVFLVLLPPLLFAAAFNTSWHDFRFHLVSILLLAFGLVGFTVLGVAAASEYLLPGQLRLAAGPGAGSRCVQHGCDRRYVHCRAGRTSARPRGHPRRREPGERCSSLLALEFAAGLVVSGQEPGFGQGLLRLLTLVGGGLVVGFIAAWLIHRLQLRLTDPPIEITLSLMAPYVSLSAGGEHARSGPLATVVCGLYLGHKSSEVFSTQARLENAAVWNTLDFLLNGIVFILIGLQLPFILTRHSWHQSSRALV